MANKSPATEAGHVSIYVTATVARVFRQAGTLKEYQKWPEPGKLGRHYTIPQAEAQRVLEAAELARDKIHRSDAPKRKGLSCFLRNARNAIAQHEGEAAFGRFMRAVDVAAIEQDNGSQ